MQGRRMEKYFTSGIRQDSSGSRLAYLAAHNLKLVATGHELVMLRLKEVAALHVVHILVPARIRPLHMKLVAFD